MNSVLWFAVGFLVGGIFVSLGVRGLYTKRHTVGYLRIDRSDSFSEPYLFLELETTIQDILRRKNVLLEVKAKDYLPHN